MSVFLRTLEYYSVSFLVYQTPRFDHLQGILFLTTNRTGAFDPAFTSRIHLSLYYPALNVEATVKLYQQHIRRAETHYVRSGLLIDIEERKILGYARKLFLEQRKNYSCWNGRQIRNAFQTALALAQFEAAQRSEDSKKADAVPKLRRKHFKDVAQASKDFDEYLRKTHEGGEMDRAAEAHYRAPPWELDGKQDRAIWFSSTKTLIATPQPRFPTKRSRKEKDSSTVSDDDNSDSSDSETDESGGKESVVSKSDANLISYDEDSSVMLEEKIKKKMSKRRHEGTKVKRRTPKKEAKGNQSNDDTSSDTGKLDAMSRAKSKSRTDKARKGKASNRSH